MNAQEQRIIVPPVHLSKIWWLLEAGEMKRTVVAPPAAAGLLVQTDV